MNILITGGAGYVGTSLIPQLLSAGHKVKVFDNLTFGGDAIIPFFRNPNFLFVKGDVRSKEELAGALHGMDAIVHLAAIVGYPACRKDPKLAEEVNLGGTRNLIQTAAKEQFIVYASTGSSYGHVREEVTEETPLNPLSLYGQTKAEAEKMIMERGNATALRFATAFGASPRLRLDLMINDFTYKAVTQKYLVVYEKHHRRSFIHVVDMGRSIAFAIENQTKMRDQIFNAGSKTMGFSKEDICEEIKKYVQVYVHYADIGKDEDQRNYVVNYDKLNQLGFETTVGIQEGIKELVAVSGVLNIKNPYGNI